MPTRLLRRLSKPCDHPDHDPEEFRITVKAGKKTLPAAQRPNPREPGYYEHSCPARPRKVCFLVGLDGEAQERTLAEALGKA